MGSQTVKPAEAGFGSYWVLCQTCLVVAQRVTESHRDRDISTLLETLGDYYRLAMISLLLVNHFPLLFFRNIFMCV